MQVHIENGNPLGSWVATQRTLHGGGELVPDRATKLETLPGWEWDADDAAWRRGYRHLEDYAAGHGDSLVQCSYCSPDGYRLNQWCNSNAALINRARCPQRGEPGWKHSHAGGGGCDEAGGHATSHWTAKQNRSCAPLCRNGSEKDANEAQCGTAT